MSYKGLTQRFQEQMDTLYGKYSDRDGSPNGQPYLEFKPNDPAREETAHDSRFSPNGSLSRDIRRLNSMFKSDKGKLFFTDQAELQTGNTFSETRLLNPLVFNPLDSTILADQNQTSIKQRALSVATGQLLSGPAEDISDASKGIGTAGRLQLATEAQILHDLVTGKNSKTLFDILAPNVLTRAISAVTNAVEVGSMGIDDRPELHLDDNYYSIKLWEGFRRAPTIQSALSQAGAKLRRGDIRGAASSLVQSGKDIVNATVNQITGIANQLAHPFTTVVQTHTGTTPNSPIDGRDQDNTSLNGRRYFILDAQSADRYLADTVIFDTIEVAGQKMDVSLPNIGFLNRSPFIMTGTGIKPIRVTDLAATPSAHQLNVSQNANALTSNLKSVSGTVSSAIPVISATSASPTTASVEVTNFAEQKMIFAGLSLGARYDNATGDVADLKDNLTTSTINALNVQNILLQERTTTGLKFAGYSGGLIPGTKIVDDAGIFASKRIKASRYFHDSANFPNSAVKYTDDTGRVITGIIKNGNNSAKTIDTSTLNTIRNEQQDLIDFMFHDYVNNRIIPFRAMISSINEQITPTFTEKRYVGRSERNVVYSGAVRDISFAFMIYAFAPEEMQSVWNKINYLTGLCFASKYDHGFMTPPFIKLTIGNVYLEQPGFIKSLNYVIDDNMSWEIDTGYQVPRGIMVNVSYSIIERGRMQTDSTYYAYGKSINEVLGLVNGTTPTSPNGAATKVSAITNANKPQPILANGSLV